MITTIENKSFINCIKIFSNFNTEGFIIFKSKGIYFNVMDEANICLNNIFIEKEINIIEEIKILVNFKELLNLIKNNKDYSITLSFNNDIEKDPRFLNISYENGLSCVLNVLNIEENNHIKNIEIPNLTFLKTFNLNYKNFKDIVKSLKDISETISFKVEKENLILSSENNLNSKMEFKILIDPKNTDDNIFSKFSKDYLLKYLKSCFSDVDLKISLNNEYPLMITQEKDNITYKFILANKVNNMD